MSTNETKIRKRYSTSIHEDERSSSSQANSLEFHYTAKIASQYIDKNTSVIEIGCGTGYYGVRFASQCKEYLGVDLSPECIDTFNGKIKNDHLLNVKAQVGDATRLEGIENSRFDVVMLLGPMYHLPSEERDLAFLECKRVCRNGGVIIIAYINKVGAYVKGCLESPEHYPNKSVNESVLNKGIDDIQPDVFFFTMPEEIEQQAKSHGLSVLKNVGVDFVFNEKIINAMNEVQFEAWMQLADFMSNSPSCTGLSNHAVIVCKK